MSGDAPRKRARLEDEGADDNDEELRSVEDAEFWFDDGTVILVARGVEFRIYGGLLAHHSPVFKELLAQAHPPPTPSSAGGDTSSCPVVHLSDSPEDLRHLLRAYMPSKKDTT